MIAMKSMLLPAILAAIAFSSAAQAQDAEAGGKLFQKCLPCHAVGQGARNKVGPVLNGLDGRKAGTAPGYRYSAANTASGIVWSKETFLDYIRNPAEKIPGTKMAFPGIKNEPEAADLWAYLAQFGADGTRK
jgi:cytochrome c